MRQALRFSFSQGSDKRGRNFSAAWVETVEGWRRIVFLRGDATWPNPANAAIMAIMDASMDVMEASISRFDRETPS